MPPLPSWQDQFARLFNAHHPGLFRYFARLSGDPDLAADLAQEALVALYRRGEAPETPGPWLVTVAMNRFRNARAKVARRTRLLTTARSEMAQADPSPPADGAVLASGERTRVRGILDGLEPREREILLLRAEGYSYREIAVALGIKDTSVGTILARARAAFLERYGDGSDPS
ncbi:MAG: sigma-70 family RNA polymerase sigma factor [Gemmatimonadales bacterium]